MQVSKLSALILTAFLVGCSTTSAPLGRYEQGIYIPTHVSGCVAFCCNHGKVNTLSTHLDVVTCVCNDGATQQLSRDPFVDEPQAPATSMENPLWWTWKYVMWGQGSMEDWPWDW